MKTLFCTVYAKWLKTFVDSPSDPLVRLIDSAAGSSCKYCMAIRMFLIGVSFALPLWASIAVCVGVGFMTWGEKRWLCDELKSSRN
jgi:hypothetical protein